MDLKDTQKRDPLKRKVEKPLENEHSPMDPPDPFKVHKNGALSADPNIYGPLVKSLWEDHQKLHTQIETIEKLLDAIKETGIDQEANSAFGDFFHYLDQDLLPHIRREEKELFSKADTAFLEKKEHANTSNKTTGTDVLREEHTKIIQLSAVCFNLYSLSTRLSDRNSCLITLDLAIEQTKDLIETLKLHVFREEQIVFPLFS